MLGGGEAFYEKKKQPHAVEAEEKHCSTKKSQKTRIFGGKKRKGTINKKQGKI